MNRLLLTGASGQVGWELARALSPLGDVIAPGRDRCDLARPETLGNLVDEVRPHVIVNAAAYTAVDQAEKESDLALKVNADAPEALAVAARRHGALLVHYSTDYVFDGSKAAPYLEADAPNPVNAYGRSKLAGEVAVRAAGCDYLIFRTCWVYSVRGKNFLRTILRLAGERETLQVVNDQFGAPTWARLIAETTALVLHQDIALRRQGTFDSGLFNLTAAGATSWHGFAAAIMAAARDRGMPIKCREVKPIMAAEYPLPARRPANSRMSCEMLSLRYGLAMPSWDTSLRLVMDELGSAINPASPGS